MVKVREVMKKNVITITPEKTVEYAAKVMTNNRVGSLIVVEKGGRVKDIVTESDVTTVVAKGMDPKKVTIGDLKKMVLKKKAGLITVGPSEDILHVAKLMVKNGIKRVPVVEDGKLKGIIADKEILIISPELIEIMSEKLKSRVSMVPSRDKVISGICESCGGYSDDLHNVDDGWLCSECRNVEEEES
jgi:CBS domain-containing protein